jgi:acyl-coenzyme A synthetase/AMP-(fatty) acid ligase
MSGALWRNFRCVAETRGSHPAFIQGERAATFSDVLERATWAGSRLIARGVAPGDRCLVWAGNSPEVAAALLGCWRAGAIAVIVNDEAPLHHVQHAAATTRPVIGLADERCLSGLTQSADCPVLTIAEAIAPADPAASVGPIDDHQPASIFFTSGSTGRPKGVTQSHANLVAGANMVARHLGLVCADRILCPVPWAFDYGYGQLLSTVLLGITQVIPTVQNQFSLCEAIERHRPTVLAALPALLALLMRGISPIRQIDRSSIRLITVTGGAVSQLLLDEVREVFAASSLSLNYGMTETYRSAGLPVDMVDRRPASVGFAYPGVTLTVLRDSGEEAEPGEVGEIVHRGTGTFLGYWGDPESTSRVLRPDPLWTFPGIRPPMAVFTGDLGWKDEAGFLTIQGRRDRLIKSMGVRISPDEIESIIRATGLVRETAVVGMPHDILGQMVVAVIVPRTAESFSLPQLKTALRETMSRAMLPRAYLPLEALPLTPNGKTDYAALKGLVEARVTVWD